jgi:hypothetical protein
VSDFNKDQGGIQSSTSTIADPVEAGISPSGIAEAPTAERPIGGPGPGVGNSRRGIH